MTETDPIESEKRPSAASFAGFCAGMLLVIAALVALGVWQIERLAWKQALIARVDARVHTAPVAPPQQAEWGAIDAQQDEYRRVTVTGTFANDRETAVRASTDLGPGFWIMTPLRLADGTAIIVNRGFVPPDRRDPASRPQGEIAGPVTITGLLRMSEPKGTLIQSNDPATDRWYSRDVAAIAERRGVGTTAPYFIDADATPNPGGMPAGGLTRIVFPNNHFVYAITWFTLAVMAAGVLVYLIRNEIKRGTLALSP